MPFQDKEKPLYMISVAAELTGVHPQTLRIYEAKGLVIPQRSAGNTRLYSQADIERLDLIGRLTDEGINLIGVSRIMNMRALIQEREAEIAELRKTILKLQNKVERQERYSGVQIIPYDRKTMIVRRGTDL